MVPVIKNFWERFTAKNYGLVSLVFVVSKIVVKFVNNKIVDHLQKCVSFGLISSFLSNRNLWVVLDGKSSQEYPFDAGVLQGSTFGPTLFKVYPNDFPDGVIHNIAIYADDNTLYS